MLGGSHADCSLQPWWLCHSFSPTVICVGRTQENPGNLEMDSVAFEDMAVSFTLEERALLDPSEKELTYRGM